MKKANRICGVCYQSITGEEGLHPHCRKVLEAKRNNPGISWADAERIVLKERN